MAVNHTRVACAALIEERRRSKVRIARIDSRAAGQQRMGEGWTAIVLQRAKQRVSIDLIARASQIATSIIIAEIVTVRDDGASVVDNISPGIASFQNRVRQIYDGLAGIVNT